MENKMKKWILAVAALNLLTFSAAEAGSDPNRTKTVITIEQENPRLVEPGKIQPVPGQSVVSPVIVTPPTGTPGVMTEGDGKVEVDKETGNLICPCPYSMDEHGQLCGEKSLYSKNNGVSPDCYDKGGANPDMPTTNIYLK
jgi:hypothetical protein